MFLPKPLKKFVGILRGEVSPILILLSVMFGFWFGLTPGWYGIHVLILAVALMLNVHIGIFLLFAGFGKALCYAAAPVLYYAGRWVHSSLGGLLSALDSLPVLGLTDYDRYAVAGALLLGPIVGLIGGLVLARGVTLFRKTWLTVEESSPAFKKFQTLWWVRWLDWLLIGKRTKDVRAALEKRPKLIRMAGVVTAAVFVLLMAGGAWFVQGDRLTPIAEDSLTRANGADVGIGRLDLSIFSGRVSAETVAVTDPANPIMNRIAFKQMTADAGLWNLLRGRLVLDEVALVDVAIDQPRSSAGNVQRAPATPDTMAEFESSRYNLADLNVAELASYVKRARQLPDWLRQVKKWLPEPKAEPPPPPAAPQSYLEYLTARAAAPATPRFLARLIKVGGLRVPETDIGLCDVQARNISDAPAAAGLPVSIELDARERPIKLRAAARFDQPSVGIELSGNIDDIDLAKFQQSLKDSNPVRFDGGTAHVELAGSLSRSDVDLTLKTSTKGMHVSVRGSLFGLDPKIAKEAFDALENLDLTLRIVGPIDEPRLVIDDKALGRSLRDALVKAGKKELAAQVDKQLAEHFGGTVPSTEEVLDDPLGAAGGVLGGLLDKSKDEKKDNGKKKDEKEKKSNNPLDQLRDKAKKKKKP